MIARRPRIVWLALGLLATGLGVAGWILMSRVLPVAMAPDGWILDDLVRIGAVHPITLSDALLWPSPLVVVGLSCALVGALAPRAITQSEVLAGIALLVIGAIAVASFVPFNGIGVSIANHFGSSSYPLVELLYQASGAALVVVGLILVVRGLLRRP